MPDENDQRPKLDNKTHICFLGGMQTCEQHHVEFRELRKRKATVYTSSSDDEPPKKRSQISIRKHDPIVSTPETSSGSRSDWLNYELTDQEKENDVRAIIISRKCSCVL